MYAVLFSAAFEGLFIGSLNPQMIILLMVITVISDKMYSEVKAKEIVEPLVQEERLISE